MSIPKFKVIFWFPCVKSNILNAPSPPPFGAFKKDLLRKRAVTSLHCWFYLFIVAMVLISALLFVLAIA